jgi:hypothetical protein
VIFGDEDDKFVEAVGGCGEDLLERGEDAEDVEGRSFADTGFVEILFVCRFYNIVEGEEVLAFEGALHKLGK